MIRVCDAIMGSGKSMSAASYMNSHSDKKFIYISPYKDDGPTMREKCPDLHMAVPATLPEFNCSKTNHCKKLIAEGRNIACTHELFKRYDKDVLEMIRDQKYTIIIDEEVAVMKECDLHPGDIETLVDGGYIIEDDDGNVLSTDKEYKGRAFRDFFHMMKNRNLYKCGGEDGVQYYYWQLPPDLLEAFEDVFILTYLFECQDIRYMLDIHGMPYQYIYIKRTEGGGYAFSEEPEYLPSYVSRITEMVEICELDRLNRVGTPVEKECPLSMNWFENKKHEEGVQQLKNNLYNYFRRYSGGTQPHERLWGTYKNVENDLRGKNYADGFLVFNKKGSNEFRHKKALAYCVNLYVSPQVKNYYAKYGITPNEDERALSIMIQWIWRSAIRDGAKINIYIPSERMRNLLKDWMARVETDAVSGRWAQHGQQFELAS